MAEFQRVIARVVMRQLSSSAREAVRAAWGTVSMPCAPSSPCTARVRSASDDGARHAVARHTTRVRAHARCTRHVRALRPPHSRPQRPRSRGTRPPSAIGGLDDLRHVASARAGVASDRAPTGAALGEICRGMAVNLTYVALDAAMQRTVGAAVAKRHAGRIIVPLFANAGVLAYLKNLLCSIRRVRVRNWIVVALDRNETCGRLARDGFVREGSHACVSPYRDRPLAPSSRVKYASIHFWRMVVQRPLWVRWLLTRGYSVLQCDVDTVWLQDPLAYFASPAPTPPSSCLAGHVAGLDRPPDGRCAYALADADMLVQSEQVYGFNCGFYFLRPTNASIRFIDAWLGDMVGPRAHNVVHGGRMHEQFSFVRTIDVLARPPSGLRRRDGVARARDQSALDEIKLRRGPVPDLRAVVLNQSHFPNGKVWHQYWWRTSKSLALVVHQNWVRCALYLFLPDWSRGATTSTSHIQVHQEAPLRPRQPLVPRPVRRTLRARFQPARGRLPPAVCRRARLRAGEPMHAICVRPDARANVPGAVDNIDAPVGADGPVRALRRVTDDWLVRVDQEGEPI